MLVVFVTSSLISNLVTKYLTLHIVRIVLCFPREKYNEAELRWVVESKLNIIIQISIHFIVFFICFIHLHKIYRCLQ